MATILVTKIENGELGEQTKIKCANYRKALKKAEEYRGQGIVVVRANRKVRAVL